MQITTQSGTATHQALVDLVVSGPLRAVTALPGGGWEVTPVTGRPLILTDEDQAHAYLTRTASTGAPALAPVRAIAPAVEVEEEGPEGCGCVPSAPAPFAGQADLMQARAISAELGERGVPAARRSAAWVAEHEAAAVRVHSDHGLYALRIPPVGKQYPVYRDGRRDGVLPARRVPAVTDATVATLFAYYLRDRAAL
ncbi:hypothetical protein ABT357_27100 [Streptomyces albidoflavus]|uniref:hypothetical protein n=1 Tax=Streptomyces albidoflavus TaxID=1886 RepID=UPI00331D6D83